MTNIVENKNLSPELAKDVDPDLQPTKKRIMGPLSYAASFMGDVYRLVHSLWGQDL